MKKTAKRTAKENRDRNRAQNNTDQNVSQHQELFKRQILEGIVAADNDEFATEEEMAALFRKFGAYS